MAATTFVQLDPEELVFRDVRLSQVYTQTLRVTNTLRAPVELTVKPGSSERYTVVPGTIRLRGEETAAVEVRLRVLRFAQRQKAVEQGHRDVFHIKGSHFDQKFHSTFYMMPDGADQIAGARARPTGGTAAGGAGHSRSPPASPTRPRRAVTKSVSFSDPSSPRGGDPSRYAPGPTGSSDTGNRGGWGAQGLEAGGGGQSPPQHVRGGLRQALSGLRSPQKGAAFSAMEFGAQDVQRDAIDRANVGGGAFASGGIARLGEQLGVSASIDFGKLRGKAAAGDSQGAAAMVMSGAQAPGGSNSFSLPSRPPRAPSQSLPPSPGRDDRTAPLPRPALPSVPVPYTGGQQQQQGATAEQNPHPLLQRARQQQAPSFQQTRAGRDSLPEREAVQPLPPFRSLEDARTSRDSESPGRSVQGNRYGGASSSPQQPLLIRPVEVRDLLGGVGTGPGGMSRAEWQQRRQEEQQRSQRRAQQDEEQAQQLIEEETRVLGLHLLRDSLDSLGMEADRLRDRSLSPSPMPPWRRGDSRTGSAAAHSASDDELEDTAASEDAARAAGRGRGREPARSRSRSRSPEAMLLAPRDRLAELVARRAGITRTAAAGSGQGLDRSASAGVSGGRRFTAALLQASSGTDGASTGANTGQAQHAPPVQEPQVLQQPAPEPPPPASYLQSGQRQYGRFLSAQAARSNAPAPAQPPAAPSAPTQPGTYGSSRSAVTIVGSPYTRMSGGTAAAGTAAATTDPVSTAAAVGSRIATQSPSLASPYVLHHAVRGASANAGGGGTGVGAASPGHTDALELQLQLRAMERQQLSMRRTIEQQQEVLKDKEELLKALQAQLQTTRSQLASTASPRKDIATEQVAAERTALANERSALAARLAEAEAALQTSREESAALRRLQLELQSRHPEVTRAVEAAVRKEQAQQEDRNRKALEMLMVKDKRIEELEAQVEDLQRGSERLRGQVAELQERAQAAEDQVIAVLRQKEALVETSQRDRQQADLMIADLEARLADGNDLAVELLATQEALAASEHRAAAAEQQLAAAEHRVMQAEAMAAGVEAMQRRLFDQRDGHVDTALAMAEELRARSVSLQEHHAEAMRLQADAHRRQVAELESRILELAAELQTATDQHGSGEGASRPRPRTTESTGTSRQAACRHQPGGALLAGQDDELLDVSLGAGMAADPRDLVSAIASGGRPATGAGQGGAGASRAAGQQRLGELQAANARLQAEVEALRRQLSSTTASQKGRAWDQAELERLRALVAERDIEVADLGSQLQVLKARLAVHGAAGAAGGQAGAGARSARSPGASPGPAYRAGGRGTAAFLSPSRERAAAGGAGAGSGPAGGRAQSAERERGAVAGGGAGSSEDAAVIETLRRQLARSDAALRGAKERLSMVEARAAVAHESAGKGEQQLEAVHRSMVGSALEHERLQQELEAARGTAAKLNGRISDLVLAEQVARAEVEAAKAKLGRLQELHTADVSELRQQLERLTDHVAASQPEVLPVLLGPAYAARASSTPGQGAAANVGVQQEPSMSSGAMPTAVAGTGQPLGGDAVTREAELEKAVDAAETAVAVMQARLLAALKEAADAAEEAGRVRREAERERDRLEAEVRAAREEGSLRIRTLEESVARLGARGGEASQALARSAAEADAAVRRESRLRSELALAQQATQRSNTQTAEIRLRLKECEAALREAQVYGGLLPFLHDVTAGASPPDTGPAGHHAAQAVGARPAGGLPAPSAEGAGSSGGGAASGAVSFHVLDARLEVKLRQQAADIARKQQVIARLVDVAEQAQGEAAAVKAELDRLKQAAPNPKQPLQQQYAEVQRRLGAIDAELRACKDAKASCELEVARLQQQLAERVRELDLAAERLAGCEREVAAKEDAAARKAIEVQGAMGKEAAVLGRRVAEAQRAADDAEARAREAEAQMVNLKAELTEARAELASQGTELRKAKLQFKNERRAADEALRQAKRAAELAKAEAEERRSQLSVLMETVEVLQAGSQGEREQRIVSLTAQLTAAANRESVAEQRAQALLADADASSSAVHQLQGEVADLEQQAARLEQELAAAASSRLTLEGELAAARADVRSRDAEALRGARELDDRQARLDRVEGELEAVRRALNDCSARHTEQLAREREEAAAAVRQARAESSGVAVGHAQSARLEKFQASLDEVVAWIESRVPPAPAAESTAAGGPLAVEPSAPASCWVVATLQRLKMLALESERSFLGAATDARVYRQESRWAWGRVKRLQSALEQRTGEWQVAQARVQMLERCVSRRSEEAAMHALEVVALQDRQLGALQERLTATMGKLVVATSQAAGAEAAMTAARATIAALQRQLTAGGAERKELAARLAAAEMESSGCAEALQLGAEAALAQRDLALRQYWDAQVSSLLARPEVKDKVMALAREVCALKLSESQLQAALAAARHRGDAAQQLAAARAASLRAAEDSVEHLAQQQLAAVSSTPTGAEGGAANQPLSALTAGGAAASGLSLEVARLSAQLVAQTHEMFRLQESELRAKQAHERRESDLQELQAQVAASELLLSQVRAESSAALLALREQLSEAHEQDRELLMRELRELQARLVATHNLAAKDVEAVEQRIAEAAQAADAAVEQRVSAALQGQVDATQLQEVAARAAKAEREAAHLAAQVEALQEALTQAQAQVGELEDVRDVTGAAVASLEATLARIEKAAADTAAAPGRGRQLGGSVGGARRVPVGGAATPGGDGQQAQPQGFAGLSRELVRAKLTEAEALRKMRAVARNEVELRQKLMQRDERITELKEQLAAKCQAYEEMRRRSALMELPEASRQAAAGPGAGAGAGVAAGSARGAAFRSRSPSPIRGGGPGVPSSRPGTAAGRRAPGEHAAPPADAAAVAAGAAADAEHLAAQVSQLRLELARRQAEIDRLHGALAEAHAAVAIPVTEPPAPSRPPTAPPPARHSGGHGNPAALDRLKDQLASANAELAAALSSANGLLRRIGSAPPAMSSAARRGGSPARGRAPAGGAACTDVDSVTSGSWPDSQLSPGALSAAMDRLTQAVQSALLGAADPSSALRRRGGAVSPTRGSAAQAEELARAQQERAAAERQRDELASRCSRMERELEAFRARVAMLQTAARPAATTSATAASAAGSAPAAAAAALEKSVAALHAMCDRVQRAVSSSTGPVDASTVQQAMHALSSELGDMESALAQLRTVMDGAHSGPPAAAPAAAAAVSGQLAAPAGAGSRRRIEPLPVSLFASLAAVAAGGSGEGARGSVADAGTAGQQAVDSSTTPARFTLAAAEHTPATTSSWATATPGTALHTGLPMPQTAGPAPAAVDTAAMTTALAAAQSQAAAMSTAAAQQKARADKWKQRSKELGAQLSLLTASASAREAAASERNLVSGQHAEQELGWCRAEIAKLQAALSGAEAARKQLEAGQGAGGSSELRAALARAAEAAARAATLQRQLETKRAQAAAAVASQREEVAVLKALVAQEKGERARLLVSLRESHTNAQQAGDSEAKLRNEALEAHSAAASARATAERREERASAWRDEASTLRQQLQQAERARAQLLSGLEMRLAGAERRATEAAAAAAARIEELVAKLAAAQAEAAAAPVAFETRLRDMEAQLAEMQVQSAAAQQAAQSSVQASRWGALTRVVRYQAAVKSLQAELTSRHAEWERERAGLQGAAETAVRRAETLLAELTDLRQQVSELKSATNADRQELTSRHVAHVQEMQQRMEQERRAMVEEADARVEAAAAATEAAAQQAAGVRLGALEAEYRGRLAALEAERAGLSRELEMVQAQFSQYQSQKAAEVAALEQRVRGYIDSGAAPAAGGSRRAAKRAHGVDAGSDEDASAAGYNSSSLRPAFGGGGGYRGAGNRALRRQRGAGSRAAARTGRRGVAGAAGSAAAGVAAAVLVPTMLQHITVQPIGAHPAGPGGAGAPLPQQPTQLAPSQLVALARGTEALSAAQREVAFERSLRCRAEAQAGLLRGAMARLRAKLRTATEELATARADAISPDEHRQLQTDLSVCREQLKSCRAESARRQKALTVLQGLVSQDGAAAAAGASAAGIGAAAPTASSAARLRAAAGGLASAASPLPLPPRVAPVANLGVSFPLPPGFDAFDGMAFGLGGGPAGGDSDPLPAALEAAAAGARATAVALEAERGARAALEAKLRETKAALDRKTILHKEAKRRMEELEAAASQRTTAAAADSGAEARAKSLAATLARKEALVRELREKLEAAAAAVERGDAAAAAGGEELEGARKAASRMKADLAKREAALRGATLELEKERKMLAAATKQLDEGSRREAAARRQAASAAAALRRRAGEMLEGLRGLARVLLQAVAAMDVAADRLRQHRPAQGTPALRPAVAAAGGGGGSSRGGGTRSSSSGSAAAGGEAMSAADISQLTSLSLDDVRHLLGPEAPPPGFGLTGGAGAAAEEGALLAQPHPLSNGSGASGAAVAASLEAAQRVGDLLAVLEVAMATAADAAADVPASPTSAAAAASSGAGYGRDGELIRDQMLAAVAAAADPAATAFLRGRGSATATAASGGGGRAGARAGAEAELWDGGTLQALVSKAQEAAQRAEGTLAVALWRTGAL